MNPTTPTEVQVITEMDVYAASVRKVVSSGNLNASPLEEPSYSWSDVEESSNQEETQVQEKPKVEEPKVQEQPKVEEKPSLTESEIKEYVDRLMTDISNIVHSDSNIKVDVELESDEDMPELGDSESDMPDLVSDTDSEMPDLVEESDDDMPDLVEDSEPETDELMIAVFKRPSCPRCEAALKILMAHEENDEESEVSEEEYTSDESDSSDDSDSDYVPSDMESEAEPEAEVEAESDSDSESEFESPRMARKREVVVPPLIKFIIIVLIVVRILKFLSNDSPNRIQCYA